MLAAAHGQPPKVQAPLHFKMAMVVERQRLSLDHKAEALGNRQCPTAYNPVAALRGRCRAPPFGDDVPH
jgi:hypothetical protein